MSDLPEILLTTSDTTVYAVPSQVVMRLDEIIVTNAAHEVVEVNLRLHASDAVESDEFTRFAIPAGGSIVVQSPAQLTDGGFISGRAGTAESLTIRVSGVEF